MSHNIYCIQNAMMYSITIQTYLGKFKISLYTEKKYWISPNLFAKSMKDSFEFHLRVIRVGHIFANCSYIFSLALSFTCLMEFKNK